MRSLTSRAVLYGLIVLLGLLCALPNVLTPSAASYLPDWYTDNTVALGLDLSGGSHLLMEVDTSNLLLEENQALADKIGDSLRKAQLYHSQPAVSSDEIRIVPQSAEIESYVKVVRSLLKNHSHGASAYQLRRDSGVLVIKPSETWSQYLQKDAVERSLEVVRRRLDETGMVDPTITRHGDDGVLVQLPGIDDPQHVRKLLGTTAKMSLHWAANPTTTNANIIELPDQSGGYLHRLERRIALEGTRIRDAQLAFNPDTNEPVVNFKLDDEGARRFGEMTRANIGRQLAIVLDDEVITAPVIRSVIAGGSGEISGTFTSAEAGDLALLLRAGALPAPLEVVEERTVGPDLGSDAIAMGISTGIIGVLLVLGFMVGIYGCWGLIACVALMLNVALVFGVLSLLGATLTLPGIAGLILSIGMAVDGNILINERIREEIRRGRSAFGALSAGFDRAFSTILDSNITTLIAISLLFMFGSGPVRGFAVTMGVGLLISLFTAVSVTRLLMEWRVRSLGRKPLVISGIKVFDQLSERTFDFMRSRYLGLVISLVLSIASIGLFLQPGLNYGIDFSGGSVVEVEAPGASANQLRDALESHGVSQASIQEFGGGDQFLVRLPMEGAEQVATGEQVEQIKTAIAQISPDASFPRVEMVGPKISGGFTEATLMAILLAGGGMLIYLWYRFESHFAIAATLTLALDLTKTIGLFALAGIEFNLTAVAALLALIGYSVNDKIVVFDRIRENLRLTPDKPLPQLLNESISSTLTRTAFTSLTTFLALLPMAISGGNAVASFAHPMLFGIVVGTTSSIFIAAPIVMLLGKRRLDKGISQLRPSAEQLQQQLDALP